MEFTHWFASMRVGGYPNPPELGPDGRLSGYDVFVNVSDEYSPEIAAQLAAAGKQSHWFPLGEAWGLCLSSIYGALNIIYQAEKAGLRVYLHCHAGVNRSQTVADAYYFMRSGKHRPRVWAEGDTRNALQRNIDNNVLPDAFTMEGWLLQMGYAVTRPMGGWMDASREQAGIPCPFGVVPASPPPPASPDTGRTKTMNHPQWSNPPFQTPIPSPLSDGLAYLHASEEQADFRGDTYRYTRLFYVCDETGESFTNTEVENHNVEQVYGPYRRRYGLPSPAEIAAFRAQYDLSAALLGKLLGFGPNQWARYESGEVPNRSCGLLLRLAIRDKQAWYSLLEAGESMFSSQPRLYSRLLAKALPA